MTRRSRYALSKVSADIPVSLVQQLDGWKANIEGISRSQLISDLLKWSLDQGAIDSLYPECEHESCYLACYIASQKIVNLSPAFDPKWGWICLKWVIRPHLWQINLPEKGFSDL